MPHIGIVRGFGEGYIATGYIIKLIKALKRRFRTKIYFTEIPLGDYAENGDSLTEDCIKMMEECDCIYIGDINSKSNPLEYNAETIAYALSNNIEYTCISGFNNYSNIDVNFAAFFDGGYDMREHFKDRDGSGETKVCSAYAAMQIVKNVVRRCEKRRRQLIFVKDRYNEYCADLFYNKFFDYTIPITNFELLKYNAKDIGYEIVFSPGQFDTVFVSDNFAQIALGVYRGLMHNGFGFYNMYSGGKSAYVLTSLINNSMSGEFVPSLCSYIVALCDMLNYEFNFKKESVSLRLAMDNAIARGFTPEKADSFIDCIIENIQTPLRQRYNSKPVKSKYVL